MGEKTLSDLSLRFAVDILNFCDSVKGHYALMNQLERSATSIGANIRESNYAQSKLDFISKLQIALKECYETDYWLDVFHLSKMMTDEEHERVHSLCNKIRTLLIASITTAKNNMRS